MFLLNVKMILLKKLNYRSFNFFLSQEKVLHNVCKIMSILYVKNDIYIKSNHLILTLTETKKLVQFYIFFYFLCRLLVFVHLCLSVCHLMKRICVHLVFSLIMNLNNNWVFLVKIILFIIYASLIQSIVH